MTADKFQISYAFCFFRVALNVNILSVLFACSGLSKIFCFENFRLFEVENAKIAKSNFH